MLSENLTKAIDEGDRMRTRVYELLRGDYKDDPRTLLALEYLDITLEHHQAILTLIKHEIYGSAFALLRPLFATLFRALWVVGCASETQVEKIASKDNFRFPKMEPLVEQVDEAFKMEGFFGELKDRAWTAMNSYTHSGLLQLNRRFSGTKVEPSYREGEILEAIGACTTTIIMLGKMYALVVGRNEEAQVLEDLVLAYATEE